MTSVHFDSNKNSQSQNLKRNKNAILSRITFLRMRKNDTEEGMDFCDKLFQISTDIIFGMLLVGNHAPPVRFNESLKNQITDIHWSLLKIFAAVFDLKKIKK